MQNTLYIFLLLFCSSFLLYIVQNASFLLIQYYKSTKQPYLTSKEMHKTNKIPHSVNIWSTTRIFPSALLTHTTPYVKNSHTIITPHTFDYSVIKYVAVIALSVYFSFAPTCLSMGDDRIASIWRYDDIESVRRVCWIDWSGAVVPTIEYGQTDTEATRVLLPCDVVLNLFISLPLA